MKNIFNVGDKVKVKDKFWEIKRGFYVSDGMKKLAGRTLEVSYVDGNGNLHAKQDDSNDDTIWAWDKKWIELYNPTITWETLKWKDVVVNKDGDEQMVLGVLNDLVSVSNTDFNVTYAWYHKEELPNCGYTIKQTTPPVEKNETDLLIEATTEQFDKNIKELQNQKEKNLADIKKHGVAMGIPCSEKFGVDVTNIKIKK